MDLNEKLALVESLHKQMSFLGNLSSEIDQIHTTQREVRHELVLLKRDEGSLNNSLADTKQHLNRMQSALEKLDDTIAADVAAGRADSISIISDVPGWRRLRHWEGRVLRNLTTPETV